MPAIQQEQTSGTHGPQLTGEREYRADVGVDHLPTIDVVLQTRMEDIPDPEPCEVCGHPTMKTLLDHLSTGAQLRVRARRTAGYRCQNPECGITAYSIEAFVESLGAASRILRERGDTATAAAFDRRIELERRLAACLPRETSPADHAR